MEPSPFTSSPYAINLEVVGDDGRALQHRPINVEDLLHSEARTMDVGHGVTLHLEDYDPAALYPDEEGDGQTYEFRADDTHVAASPDGLGEAGDAAEDTEGRFRRRAGPSASPLPPGTVGGNWYDVLNALRREREDVEEESARLAAGQPSDARAPLSARAHSARGTVSTPLVRFPASSTSLHSRASKSLAPASDTEAAKAPAVAGRSRREVWSAFATPIESTRNYRRLEYVSVLAEQDPRHFRPSALAFHAMTSYLHAKDRCQRVLVYGGLSQLRKGMEKELYEFSLLTGAWRRLEGRQFVPAGHYGHAMVVVEAVDRLIVVGGVGPGGLRVPARGRRRGPTDNNDDDDDQADHLADRREQLLFPLLQSQTRLHGRTSNAAAAAAAKAAPLSALSTPSALNTTVGFVPFLFDMELTTQRWRAVEPATPFPVAFHTAVAFGREVFVFGGITDALAVSGQLLAIHVETYSVRLVGSPHRRDAAVNEAAAEEEDEAAPRVPAARYLHSAVRYGNYMLVFGGLDFRNAPLDDLWAFDLVNERWERLSCRGVLHPRWGHAACVAGNRLLIAGGFECDLDESPRAHPVEAGGEAGPTASVMEINLIPTSDEHYLCRESLTVKPPLPPLAFGTAAPCGDGTSLIMFGGLTNLPKKRARKKQSKAGARARQHSDEDDDTDSDDHSGSDAGHADGAADDAAEDGHEAARTPALMTRYPVFADALVTTFPVKAVKKADEEDGDTYVNELGIEVNKNELPEHFKAFVRRQDDFLKKKAAANAEAMHRTTMEEKEAMEPTLYLSEDEIERLISRSEACCTAFTESYKMDELPSNVPDREERIHITEECVSLSRQVRDVMKSMKAAKVGVTAVKSKDHRRRGGQKFEDYSAAKPFRRIVVAHLLDGIQTQLHDMHRLNRGLHTIIWEEKQGFLDAIKTMQDSVDGLNKTIGGIVNQYISRRVEGLMKGVDKHKEVMRLLTEVVERNRRDKIFNKDQQVDKQRERVKRAWASAAAQEDGEGHKKGHTTQKTRRSPGASPSGIVRSRSASAHHRHSLGAGYYKEEASVSIALVEAEWEHLHETAAKVERCAAALQTYCEQGMTAAPATTTVASPMAPTAPGLGVAPVSPDNALPVAAPPSVNVLPAPSPPMLGLPPAPLSPPVPTLGVPGMPLQTTLSPPALAPGALPVATFPPALPGAPAPLPTPPSLALPTSGPALVAPAPAPAPAAEAGVLSNKDIVVRHSNELRQQIATAAQTVGDAARTFFAALSGAAESSAAHDAATPSGPAPLPLPVVQRAPATGLLVPPSTTTAATTTTATTTTTTTTTTSSSSSDPHTLSPPPTSATTAAAAPAAAPSSASPVVVAADGKRELSLSTLRPLLEAREQLAKAVAAAPGVRRNDWDANNLAGAPQDERVEALCKRLQQHLTGLVQRISGSFLSASGARKPRKRIVQLSTVQPAHLPHATAGRPPRGPSGARAVHSTRPASRAASKHDKKSSSHRESSSGPSTRGLSRTTATTTTATTTTGTTGSSSSDSSSSSSSRSSSSSSSSSSSTESTSGKATRRTVSSGRHVVAVPSSRDSAAAKLGPRSTPRPVESGGRATPSALMAQGKTPPGRATTTTALQPLYTGPKSHLVQLSTLNGSDPATASTRTNDAARGSLSGRGQRRAGATGATLTAQAVPLVPFTPDLAAAPGAAAASTAQDPRAPPPLSAFDAPSESNTTLVEASRAHGTQVVANTPAPQVTGTAAVPLSGIDANARNVFMDAGGTRPRFANDWALLPTAPGEKRLSATFFPVGETAAPSSALALHEAPATVAASFTRGVGPVMHAPVARPSQDDIAAGSPSATGAGARSRRSTISLLAQLHPEAVHATSNTTNLEPATSISPGTFVVNADYYAQAHGQARPAGTASETLPGQLPGAGAAAATTNSRGDAQHHWADVDEDYFYFGQTVHRGGGGVPATTATTTADTSASAFADVTNRAAAARTAGKSTLAAPSTSPPVGTVLRSQRVNASYAAEETTAAGARAGRRPATGRPLSSSVAATGVSRRGPSATARTTSASAGPQSVLARGQQTAIAGGATVNVSGTGPFRGRLTPGERQILEARERLRRH